MRDGELIATETVYVQLLDEGVDVWRPVEAEPLGGDRYRLLATPDYDPEFERWAFLPGSIVRCKPRRLTEGTDRDAEVVAVVEEIAEP
jgi:hypothetical protein